MSDQTISIPKVEMQPISQEVSNEKPVQVAIPDVPPPQAPQAKDDEFKKITIPMTGKLVISDHDATIGSAFAALKNMRYTDTHVKGIGGMTKINTTPIASGKTVDSMFHFAKAQRQLPAADAVAAESHLLAHIYDGTESYLVKNDTAIPGAGDFSATRVLTDTERCTKTFMDNAPLGQVAYCNGVENYIWGGAEISVGAFVTSTAAITTIPTNPGIYTERMLNTLSDSKNIVTVGGGTDSYVKSLIHWDGVNDSTTITDEVAGRAWTAVGNAKLSTSYKEFGSASLVVDGTGDYIEHADHADFALGTGDFTIEARFKRAAIGAVHCIVGHANSALAVASSSFYIYVGSDNYLYGLAYSSGTTYTAKYGQATWTDLTSFHHVAFVRNGSSLYVYLDGVRGDTAASIGTASVNDCASKFAIGRPGEYAGYYCNGYIDEFRLSVGTARWTEAAFAVPAGPYSTTASVWAVGSVRPLQGMKYYVSRVNSVASTLTVQEWTGSAYPTLTATDNTSSGGVALAQTGTITWASTVNTSKVKYMCGAFLYWYIFTLSAGEADIYFVTLDAPMQPIVDLWDGLERSLIMCYYSDNGVYTDYSDNVYDTEYYSTDATTYMPIAAMTFAQDSVLVGFTERQAALNITMPSDGKVNSTACVVTPSYCTGGTNFATITAYQDTTSVGGKTLNKSGTISWSPPDSALEVQSDLGGTDSFPLYWYKLTFSANVGADTRIDCITGIPAQSDMKKYKFPLMALDSLFLCGEVNGAKNRLINSAQGTSQVFNGDDVYEIDFGDDRELTGGCVLYSQFGSSIFNLIMLFKANETWALIKNTDGSWTRYVIDTTVGLAAPNTIKTTTLPLETATGLNRNLAIWQGSAGIYVSDGRSPVPIHKDIETLFDQNSSVYIHPSYSHLSSGFMDFVRLEYHWCFASNSSVAGELDKEFVFDLKRWKWFEAPRAAGKELQHGCSVKDANENSYAYGLITDGYVERLEYGNSFDGEEIVSQLQFGDMPLAGDVLTETFVEKAVLTMANKTATSGNATLTHCVDGSTSGAEYSFDPKPVTEGKSIVTRVASPTTEELSGIFHSFDLSMTTSNELVGFEPLHFSVYFRAERNITQDKA